MQLDAQPEILNHHAPAITHNQQIKKELFMDKDKDMDALLEGQKQWELDNLENTIAESKRNKFLVTGMVIILIIMGSALFYNLLTAKKETYREVVDPYTGHTIMEKVYTEGEVLSIKKQELYLKSDIYKFINCFEGYSKAEINSNLKCVHAFASQEVYWQYQQYIGLSGGVKSLIGSNGVMNVTFGHITTFPNDKNTVISEILLMPEGSKVPKGTKPIPKLITLVFEYKQIPSKLEKFLINPHGMKVTMYNPERK